MPKDENELRGLLVGEARGVIEGQHRIEMRVNIVLALSAVTLVSLIIGSILAARMFADMGPGLKASVASLNTAIERIVSAVDQVRAMSGASEAAMAKMGRRIDRMDNRLGRCEDRLAMRRESERTETRQTGRVASTSRTTRSTAKRSGCLGIF